MRSFALSIVGSNVGVGLEAQSLSQLHRIEYSDLELTEEG
jgi:hypothetical protein